MFKDCNKQSFLFRCEDCEMIVSVTIDDEEDLEKIRENKMELECPCKGISRVLLD